MLTNYQQLIISLAPFAPALNRCDPALLTGYAIPPTVQLIKTSDGNKIRVMVPANNLAEFLKNYGVNTVGTTLETVVSLTPNTLIDLDSIDTGVVDILVTEPCAQLQTMYPMDTSIACYADHHDHLQLLVSMNIAEDRCVGWTYYSRNFNEDFCVINVYHFGEQGQLLGISTETWYDGASSYHQFGLRGINVYQCRITGSHRNDLSRIYLNITPPAGE